MGLDPHSRLSPRASPAEAHPGPGHHRNSPRWRSRSLGGSPHSSAHPCTASRQDALSRGKARLEEERDLLLIEHLLYARPEKTLQRDVLRASCRCEVGIFMRGNGGSKTLRHFAQGSWIASPALSASEAHALFLHRTDASGRASGDTRLLWRVFRTTWKPPLMTWSCGGWALPAAQSWPCCPPP